ncbi:putative Ig heavy chain V region MC101 protein, partial [Naja naja]
ITSEITITQSAAQVKRPGERLWLTCAVSGFSLTSCGISWIRQVSGKELEWIGDIWHGGGTAYSTIFQSRASITKDNSKSEVYLQLNALKAEDTAITLTQSSPVIKNQGESLQLKCSITGFDIYNHYMDWLMKKPGYPLKWLVHFVSRSSSSSHTVIESSGDVKRPGESIKLTCTVSGFSVAEAYMDWLRQRPGEGLEWVGRVAKSGSAYYNSILQSRLTIRKDTSNNQFLLQLSGLKPEDTALYSCTEDTHPVIKNQGESVQLKCSITGFDIIHHYMNWLMKRPGKPLYSGYSPGVQGRFTASKDSSNFYLQVNDLKMEDTTVYYCTTHIDHAP